MERYDGPTPEERARITEIQDLLIERFAEHKTALEEGDNLRARAIGEEIKALQREKQEIQEWATTQVR